MTEPRFEVRHSNPGFGVWDVYLTTWVGEVGMSEYDAEVCAAELTGYSMTDRSADSAATHSVVSYDNEHGERG